MQNICPLELCRVKNNNKNCKKKIRIKDIKKIINRVKVRKVQAERVREREKKANANKESTYAHIIQC